MGVFPINIDTRSALTQDDSPSRRPRTAKLERLFYHPCTSFLCMLISFQTLLIINYSDSASSCLVLPCRTGAVNLRARCRYQGVALTPQHNIDSVLLP